MKMRLLVGLAGLMMLGMVGSAGAITYSITDYGDAFGAGTDINFNGQMVGNSNVSGFRAISVNGGTVNTLQSAYDRSTEAIAINNHGQIIGNAAPPIYVGPAALTYLWNNTVGSSVPVSGYSSAGTDINDLGQIVGITKPNYSSPYTAYLYENGITTNIGKLYGTTSSYPISINNYGQVAGTCESRLNLSTTINRAFVWDKLTGMVDLGTLGGDNSAAFDVNSSGEAVGHSSVSGNSTSHAFLWKNNVMTDLGTLGGLSSTARGVNESGEIVGSSMVLPGVVHAFLWQDGVMVDLNSIINDESWVLGDARHIDDLGRIVGYGMHNGVGSGYMLTPIEEQIVAPVPEPSTMLLLGGGLAGLAFWRRKKS